MKKIEVDTWVGLRLSLSVLILAIALLVMALAAHIVK